MLAALKQFGRTFFLVELLKGMQLTGATSIREKDHCTVPRGEDPKVAAVSRIARVAPLPERRRTLYRL